MNVPRRFVVRPVAIAWVCGGVGGLLTLAVERAAAFTPALLLAWVAAALGITLALRVDAGDRGDDAAPIDPVPQTRTIVIAHASRGHFSMTRAAGGSEMWVEYYVGTLGHIEYGVLDRAAQLRATALLLESLQGISLRDARAYHDAQREIARELAHPKH